MSSIHSFFRLLKGFSFLKTCCHHLLINRMWTGKKKFGVHKSSLIVHYLHSKCPCRWRKAHTFFLIRSPLANRSTFSCDFDLNISGDFCCWYTFSFCGFLKFYTQEFRVVKRSVKSRAVYMILLLSLCPGLHFLACACSTDSPRCDRPTLVNAAAPLSALWPSDISSVYSLPILLLRRHLQVLYGRDIKIGRIYGRKSAARFKAPPAWVQCNYSALLLPATLIYYSRQDRNYHTEMSWSKKSFAL